MNFKWKGIMPAVTTKFLDNDKLDLKTFKINIEEQLSAGVHGIVLGGSLGESSTLDESEKKTLLNQTVEIVSGRIPVIMNIAASSTKKAIESAILAERNGASGLMILPPMKYKADNRETLEFFKKIATKTSLEIMIYNNPVDYGIEVTLSMFEELMSIKNIVAVKESTRNISNITKMKAKFGDRYKILAGVDTLALESLMMGADGWVAGLVCAFPKETVAIYELYKAGRTKEAIEIYRWFLPLLELDTTSKLVQNIKLAEVATGIGTEKVREPRLPLIGKERKNVIEIIEKSLKTRPKLPNY
ncbi:MAG: dihydrodipicolinate synthase family protein [Flavobacteriaceae bacterium]|nr:dihydrodipicolinate synthase family protein [Flavobacteriaceae bacterium]|tara:strand:- start:36176 stop:37081 length:906 start_codon:yes stop_codon:yes gene_type:complete